ncbi:MAG: TIGR01212 family radical SAM protein [Thermodesulfobacteriota bacterium]
MGNNLYGNQGQVKQMTENKRYYDLNTYFRSVFGCRIHKITIDAGFSCPNRDGTLSSSGCIFCNNRGSGTGAHAAGLSIAEQIRNGRKVLSRRFGAQKFIAYFQAYTNTYAPLEKLKAMYDEALAEEDIVGLSVGTRPDCIDPDVLALLESYTDRFLVWLEVGVQSACDRTLAVINRGHDFACAQKAIAMSRNRGIRICGHMILGLPGETAADMIHTAEAIAALGIDGIKIHLLYVVRDTPLAAMLAGGDYRCLEQQEYVDRVCDVLERLPAGMVVQRLTGDPHPAELVAPLWAMRKQETLTAIHDTLAARDTWQGKCCQAGAHSVPGKS